MSGRVFVLPTVDTEGVHGSRPFEQMVLGQVGGGRPWGVHRISEIFTRMGVEGTFYVDVYEDVFHGEEPLRKLCEDLVAQGQDLGLHTHPAWRDDPDDSSEIRAMKRGCRRYPQDKDLMYRCSPGEQREVLELGLDMLKRWADWRPVSHRAGGYGADVHTLRALAELGVPMDSSLYHGHPNCRLSGTINAALEMEGVLQIPVTVFARHRNYRMGIRSVRREIPYCKTDIDHCRLDELGWFLDEAKRQGLRLVNLFMHSYSLVSFDRRYRRFCGDPRRAQRLERFLARALEDPDVEVLSMRQLHRRLAEDPECLHGPDMLPILEIDRSPFDLFLPRI